MGFDYSHLGLNAQLRSVNSPLVRQQNTLTGYDVDTSFERDSITRVHLGGSAVGTGQIDAGAVTSPVLADLAVTAAKIAGSAVIVGKIGTSAVGSAEIANTAIGSAHIQSAAIGSAAIGNAAIHNVHINNFSFSQGTGGTLVLGGTTNGNGIFNLRNSAGSNVVTMDNTGLTVEEGSITVKSSAGSTVLDSRGVVSLANFEFGGTSLSAEVTTTGTTYADLDGMSLTTSNFSGTRNVLILFTAQHNTYAETAGDVFTGDVNYIMDIDGTDETSMFMTKNASRGNQDRFSTHTMHLVKSLGTGTHTIKTQWRIANVSEGTPKASTFRRSLTYLSLGN